MVREQGYVDGKPIDVSLSFIGKDTKNRPAFLRDDAAAAFAQLVSAAKRAGVDILINTAFRDHLWQTRLWDEYQEQCKAIVDGVTAALPICKRGKIIELAQKRGDDWTDTTKVATVIARAEGIPCRQRPLRPSRPGFSPHERGCAVDIDMRDEGGARPCVSWLSEHAHEFGFAQTVLAEPWHWAFVAQPTRELPVPRAYTGGK